MIQLTVKTERLKPVKMRHPWIFSGALQNIPDGIESGTPVEIVDEHGDFLASGYFNSYSQIAVRVWSWQAEEKVDDDFFRRRIAAALKLRQNYLGADTDAYRLISSENDFLPGLIVDRYADYLSVQFHTRGIEFWRDQIVSALKAELKPKGIYERSEVRARGIEGAADQSGLLLGEVPEKVKITENGFKFWVDIIGGQKTGFFLDQRDKRQALAKYAKDKSVLNCFSYTGGFSVYALSAGAKKAVSVDMSQSALELAKENIKLNGLDLKKCEFIATDVKKYLRESVQPEEFEVIILDPPAFIKDRRKIKEGITGYRHINESAIRLLPPGGILVTASCSAHLKMPDFRFLVSEAAGRAGRTLRILESYTHGLDHPQLTAFNESEYLKCLFAQID